MRTISVRAPIAIALLHNGCGVIGKTHAFADKRFGLHCSTQTNPTQGGNNNEIAATLSKAGLMPPMSSPVRHSAPLGHVFASCRVVGWLARGLLVDSRPASVSETLQALRARICEVVAPDADGAAQFDHLSEGRLRAWLQVAGTYARLYILADVTPCEPALWKGVMSCFPVPEYVFSRKPKA